MAATRSDISTWFDRGVTEGKSYMLVICDTFDHDDYPSFFNTSDAAIAMMEAPGDMQRFMEAYDLTAPKEPQMTMRRANCFAALKEQEKVG